MSYTIRKTNGETLTILADGQMDNSVSSLTLIGKNVSNFGGTQNTNMVQLLENFAFNYQPPNPIPGQIWFNTAAPVNRLAFYTGTSWRPIGVTHYSNTITSTVVGSANPFSASQIGDFWFDTNSNQLKIVTSTNSNTTLIGPEAVSGFGTTKMSSVAMYDTTSTSHPVIQITLNGEVIGVVSNIAFTTDANGVLLGFPYINRGITFKDPTVALNGEVTKLDNSYTRRNIDENIYGNWTYTTGSVNFGSLNSATIAWNNGLQISSTSSIKLVSGNTTVTVSNNAIIPSGTVNIGSTSSVFATMYASTLSGGSSTAYGSIDGAWHLTQGSSISTAIDSNGDIGAPNNRIGTIYTKNLSSGGTPSIFNGQWQVNTGTSFTPLSDNTVALGSSGLKFANIFTNGVSAGQPTNQLAIIGALSITGSVNPSGNTNDIGSSVLRWNNIYGSNADVNTATIKTANITTETVSTSYITSASVSSLVIGSVSDMFGTSIAKFDTDVALAANSDGRISTQKAVKAYIDNVAALLSTAINNLQTSVNNQIANLQIIGSGTIMYLAGSSVPSGYLLCDGSAVSKTTYPSLFAAIGYTYGGSLDTFYLPDMRGVFPRGVDMGRGVDPNRVLGSYQGDDFKSHTHHIRTQLGDAITTGEWISISSGGGYINLYNEADTQATGGTETRPKNVALLPVIKV